MEINIQATIGECSEYVREEGAEPATISVVIAPLKIVSSESSERTQIISGCNMFQSCHNPNCWYSITARQNKKA